MAIGDRVYKWIVRESLGSARIKNEKDVLKISAGYTRYNLMPAVGSTTAIAASIAGTNTGATTASLTTNPDVPRVLTVAGLSAAVAGTAVVTGTNIEGKTITDSFALNGTATITGVNAFKSVSSISFPTQTFVGAAVKVGTANVLGLYHRLEPGQFTIRVVLDTTSAATSLDNQTFDAQPTVTANERLVERNVYTPVTAPDGAHWFRVYYAIFSWSLNNQDGNEVYFTSTSTSSTSSSTSTTTVTTSTSSTSTSISSTSTSSTSTSLSTSSTSTSTTTLP